MWLQDQHIKRTGTTAKPERPNPTDIPMPMFEVHAIIAADWGIPPWELRDPDMQDELGREIERRSLHAQYAVKPGRDRS